MPDLLETLVAHNASQRAEHRSRGNRPRPQTEQANSNSESESDNVLALNAGSSSLKFKLYNKEKLHGGDQVDVRRSVILSGSVKLRREGKALLKASGPNGTEQEEVDSDEVASPSALDALLPLLRRYGRIVAVAHRIVHGASLPHCIVVTKDATAPLDTLTFLSSFAPLHNAVAVALIRTVLAHPLMSTDAQHDGEARAPTPHYCCFDTVFHHSIPPSSHRYLLDPELAGRNLPAGMEMRKWGFHGLSYASIVETLRRRLGSEAHGANVIVAHLGSGSSVCAIRQGRSCDTTMGLTPLEGLPGGTRSGSVDPALVLHISREAMRRRREEREKGDSGKNDDDDDASDSPYATTSLGNGIRVSQAELILNKQSGFAAVCGTSDFSEVVRRALKEGDEEARLCFDVFVERLVEVLGAYCFKLSSSLSGEEGGRVGVDALVFSGGIGEASEELHRELAKRLERTALRVGGSKSSLGGGRAGGEGLVVRLRDGMAEGMDEGQEGELVFLEREGLGLKDEAGGERGGVPWLVCKTDEEGEMVREVGRYLAW